MALLAEFEDRWQKGSLDEGVRRLCQMATQPDRELARQGGDAIFRRLVEQMGDAFEPRLCDLYVCFFAKVLQYCRALPAAAWLDSRLQEFGLLTEEDLAGRANRIRRGSRVAPDPGRIRKIVVLSRVTLGADVAVTSVVLRKMAQAFPAASLVLVGGRKAARLFAADSRVAACPIEYPRGGGLLERLSAWPAVVEAIARETAGLEPAEYLIVDPDSRLTQLGMLPVTGHEPAYRFFESRSFAVATGGESLAELTSAWLEQTCGDDSGGPIHPWVALPWKAAGWLPGHRWASVSFGAGDNPRKRLPDPFEQRLLFALLEAGWRLVLDQGDGQEELARAGGLLSGVRAAGRRVAEIEEASGPPPSDAEVVAWRGSLEGFGACIAESRLYVGYDSAGSHLAAALGVPVIDIFAGFRWPRMPIRWRPCGPGPVTTIVVDPARHPDPDLILARVLEAAR